MPHSTRRVLLRFCMLLSCVLWLLVFILRNSGASESSSNSSGDSPPSISPLSREVSNSDTSVDEDVPHAMRKAQTHPRGIPPILVKPSQSRTAPPAADSVREELLGSVLQLLHLRFWQGDTIAVFGENIEAVVKHLQEQYRELTLIGGEMNATAIGELQREYTTASTAASTTMKASRFNNTFFHLEDLTHDIMAHIPRHSVDAVIVWDVEGTMCHQLCQPP